MREPETLRKADEALLYWLHIQPSEIDMLDMEDYLQWAEMAAAVAKSRSEA